MDFLSVCIATKNRSNYIKNLINYFNRIKDIPFEIIIIDGSDEIDESLKNILLNKNINFLYKHVQDDSGLDRAYDLAVRYSNGNYCWLFSDDDLFDHNIVNYIYKNITQSNRKYDLYILNFLIKDTNLENTLVTKRLKINESKEFFFNRNTNELLNNEIFMQLSYIGSIIIKKEHWIKNSDDSYFGCYFSHIVNIFNTSSRVSIKVLHEPMIFVRIDNESWKKNHLLLWHYYWPELMRRIKIGFNIPISKEITIERISFPKLVKYYILNCLNVIDFKLKKINTIQYSFIKKIPKKLLIWVVLLFAFLKRNNVLIYKLKRLLNKS